ncbi:MAG: hypothetical protein IPM57_11765 [Oligoflexia bacterium]|nr:hypothetical protein [Oligoflexia bacterium]
MILLAILLQFIVAHAEMVLDLPPYDHYRTDFQWSEIGSEQYPIRIAPQCTFFPVEDWQKSLCEHINQAARTFKNTFSYNTQNNFARYWALHVNDEPAFQSTNWGPPGQSLPINTGLVTVEPLYNGIRLGLSNEQFPGFIPPGGTPFIGYGLQADHGGGCQNVLPHKRFTISFYVTLEDIQGDDLVGDSIHFWIQTQTLKNPIGRYPNREMLWLFLGEKNTGANASINWNWPVIDSMFYPGNPIHFMTASHFSQQCGQQVEQIPLTQDSVGKTYFYHIDIEKMVNCMGTFGPKESVSISGIWFALENNMPRLNSIKASFTNVFVIEKKPGQ